VEWSTTLYSGDAAVVIESAKLAKRSTMKCREHSKIYTVNLQAGAETEPVATVSRQGAKYFTR